MRGAGRDTAIRHRRDPMAHARDCIAGMVSTRDAALFYMGRLFALLSWRLLSNRGACVPF